jgi:putative protease
MDQRPIELLAPAGKWEALEKVAAAGADAVYLGGKRFNMRLLRTGFNFSDREIQDAVTYLHQQNKRLYITINNLYYDNEIQEMSDYLLFLEELGVDALIIQDIAIIKLHQQLGLTVPLHASVQMGLGTAQALSFLADHGVSRVILSKNLSLQEIAQIHKENNMTIEYFAHGDLCISHTGQCVMSNLIAGESGNRGKCIKPCRWQYTLKGVTSAYNEPLYFLAHKDLCLYSHLQALLEAGVSSFKIEGRMREADYLAFLVGIYRNALDCILEDRADAKDSTGDVIKLEEKRVRDFSTGNLFGRSGLESIGLKGDREPFFPTRAHLLDRLQPEDYSESADNRVSNASGMEISVKVAGMEMLNALNDTGVNRFILGYEHIRQYQAGWNKKSIAKALDQAREKNLELVIETPRIVCGNEFIDIENLFAWMKSHGLTTVVVNDYGSLNLARNKGLRICGGPGLNLSNQVAVRFLKDNGLERITASLELDFTQLEAIRQSEPDIEVMVHGPLCGMVSDFCPAGAVSGEMAGNCSIHCLQDGYALLDEYGQHYYICSDTRCRSYIYYPYDLCLFSYLPQIAAAGMKYLRLDGQYYEIPQLVKTVSIYRQGIDDLEAGQWQQKNNYLKLLQLYPRGLTAVPYFR